MPLTAGDVLSYLSIVVAVMIIIVLYHVLFIVVDIRKILRRADDLTEQVEEMLLKPISMADHAMQWVMDLLDKKKEKKDSHHHVMDHHRK